MFILITTTHTTRRALRPLVLTLGLLGGGLTAQADTLQRVQVQGQTQAAAHTEVRARCPAMEEELQQRLGWVLQQRQQTGLVRVDFELGAVASPREVAVSGGPALHYRKEIRRVMHDQRCQANSTAAQRYSLLLSFETAEDRADGRQRVALLAPR